MELLNSIVSPDGVEVDAKKVAAVQDAPAPSGQTSLQSFLGFAGYYRIFIKIFAEIFAVIHPVTSRTANFYWHGGMQETFDKLKLKLTSAPVLVFPDFEQQFIFATDVSPVANGSVLSQKKEDGKLRPFQLPAVP